MKTITLDGKTYSWREVLKTRREQQKAQRQPQLTLFDLKEDSRPLSQQTASGRLAEPLLFEHQPS